MSGPYIVTISRKIKDANRFTNLLQQIERRLTYKKLIRKE